MAKWYCGFSENGTEQDSAHSAQNSSFVHTVQVPTGYMYGNVSWAVPCTVQLCVTRSYVWDCGEQTGTTYTYSGTGTLVPRGPYEGTEQASVDVSTRGSGNRQFYSC